MKKTGRKARLIVIYTFILTLLTALSPFKEGSALVKRQVVILNLPDLEMVDLAKDYPNLLKLVATGTTGLVRLPAAAGNGRSNFFGLPVTGKRSAVTVTIGQSTASAPENPYSAIIRGGFKDVTGLVLKFYRRARERSKAIIITFHGISQNRFGKRGDEYRRRQLLRFYDRLIAGISDEIDFDTTLLVVCSPRVTEKPEMENVNLTPVILKGAGFTAGVLYSPGTRKQGIVTYNDLRSTVLGFLNPGKTETVFQIKKKPGDWRKIAESRNRLIKNHVVRRPLLSGYGYLLLGTLSLLIIGLIFRLQRRIITGLAWGYLFLITVPAAFLLEALLDPLDWFPIILYTLGITGALFLWSYWISGRNIFRTLLWISLITAGLAVGDALSNGYYECKSFLGYSVISGARYYGIGNEYMGILLGSYIVGCSLSFQGLKQWRREILWPAAFFTGLILIHPNLGADVGGGLTALTGLGVTNYLWLKQPIRPREIARLGLMALVALVLAGAWDLSVNRESMSHLGQLLLAVRNHGPGVFMAMVIRKITLNLRLIGSTPLTLVLIGILLTIPVLRRVPPAPLQSLMNKQPEAISGLTGLAVTALIGFLLNDSGIVSAAMIFMFGIGLILTVIIGELAGTRDREAV